MPHQGVRGRGAGGGRERRSSRGAPFSSPARAVTWAAGWSRCWRPAATGSAASRAARSSSRARFRADTGIAPGDVLDPDSLRVALDGVHTAYYLVHSMGASGDFEEQDRTGARNFARAARERGVRRVIYLGGLRRARALAAPREPAGGRRHPGGRGGLRPSSSGLPS